jgi:glycopeptide antibiotics resistance protein
LDSNEKKIFVTTSLAVYLVILFYFTLFWTAANVKDARTYLNLVPFRSIDSLIRRKGWASLFDLDITGNILAFVPLGLLLPLLSMRLRRASLIGLISFALSSFIETLQYISNTRYTDIDDIILNTMGSIMGYLAYCLFKRF